MTDNRDLVDIFVYETENMLHTVDDAIIRNEGASLLSEKDTNELFRVMHTIKGSAAMLQLTAMSTTAHKIEDIFSLIRAGSAKTGIKPMKMILRTLLLAMEYFQKATEALTKDADVPGPPDELVKYAEETLAAIKIEPDKTEDKHENVPAAKTAQQEAWVMDACKTRIVLKPTPLPCARALVVLKHAQSLCANIVSIPAEIEKHQELAHEIISNGFIAAFIPAAGVTADDVIGQLKRNVHVSNCELEAKAVKHIQSDSKANKSEKIVSVRQSKLIEHVNVLGELLTTETILETKLNATGKQDAEVSRLMLRVKEATAALRRSADEMSLVNVSGIFYRLRIIVREMCSKLGKDASLICSGGEVEVDRNMLDQLYDPLMHMIRNAVDHGIESREQRKKIGKPERGTIRVDVSSRHGDYISVVVSDDGAGINLDRVYAHANKAGLISRSRGDMEDRQIFELLLRPGFTMNESVSEYSGRGVGLDVVNMRVRKLGGKIEIHSTPDRGSSFVLTLPTQVSVVETVEVTSAGHRMLVPLGSVRKIMKSDEFLNDAAKYENGTYIYSGVKYDLVCLSTLIGTNTVSDDSRILLCEGDKPVALYSDNIQHVRTTMITPFPHIMRGMKFLNALYTGCAVMNDGSISMVLNTDNLSMISRKAGTNL